MSHHHVTLPPLIYTPEPPKPKEAKRRRRIGNAEGADGAGETEEAGESDITGLIYAAAQPKHQRPVEAVERRNESPTGKLSGDTMKALLAAQEENGQG